MLMPDAAPEFMEVSLRGRQDPYAVPAAVLHTGTVTVKLFEDTPRELLEAILKAVWSFFFWQWKWWTQKFLAFRKSHLPG